MTYEAVLTRYQRATESRQTGRKKQDKTRIAKSRAILTRDKSYSRLLTVEKETAKQ